MTHRADPTPLGAAPEAGTAPAPGTLLALARPALLALVLLCATTLLFVEAFHSPSPHHVRVGVVGGPAQAAPLRHALDQAAPGGFSVRAFSDQPAARRAVSHAEIFGAIVPTHAGYEALTATAYGVPAATAVLAALRGFAAHTHRPLAVDDVVPLPAHDRFGISSLFCVVAVLIPSLVVGGLLTLFASRESLPRRLGAILAYAVLAALLATLNVDTILGALTNAAAIALVCGALAVAVASTTHGLARLLGAPGLGLAILILLVLGLPSSGGAVGHDFQPAFYGAVSPWLPSGAALTALRNAVYFHWSGVTQPLLALAGWALLGVVLLGLDSVRGRRRREGALKASTLIAAKAAALEH